MTTTYLLDDVTALIDLAPNQWIFGTNLFAGLMPDTPDVAIACFEYEGMGPIYTMGPNSLPAIAQPDLQVVSRGTSYTSSRANAEGIARLLEAQVNTTLSGTLYLRIARLQDPFFMHRDKVRNRVYFACNYSVMRCPS